MNMDLMDNEELNERLIRIRDVITNVEKSTKFNLNELKRLDKDDFYLFWYVDKHLTGFKRNSRMDKVRERLCQMFDFDKDEYLKYSLDFYLMHHLQLFKMEAAVPYKDYGIPYRFDEALAASHVTGKKFVLLNLEKVPQFSDDGNDNFVFLDSIITVTPDSEVLSVSNLKQHIYQQCVQFWMRPFSRNELCVYTTTLTPGIVRDIVNVLLLDDSDLEHKAFTKFRTILDFVVGQGKVRNLLNAWQLTHDTDGLIHGLYEKQVVIDVPQVDMPDFF